MGEVLQLQNRHNPDISEENYLDVLRYKTGTLFSAATQAGAIIAYRPFDEIKLMQAFGENLGIAFQLVDDMLDYTADEKTLGKNVGDDLKSLGVGLVWQRLDRTLNDEEIAQTFERIVSALSAKFNAKLRS